MQKVNLDDTDLKILRLLSKDGRLSYRSIGLTVDLTTKSVKSRVDRMVQAKVIERFLAIVNPTVIGYNKTCAFALRVSNEAKQEFIDRINLVGDVRYQFEVMGGVIGFDIAIKEGTEDKVDLLLSSLKPALLGIIQSCNRGVTQRLTETDYEIIRELVKNPRKEIQDIAATTAISSKTVRRRIDRLTKNHVIEFSIQPNPDAMRGYIVFFLDVKIKSKSYQSKVIERIYEELHDHLMPLSSDMSRQEDTIGLLLGSKDAEGIESTRSRVELFDGVERVGAFLPIRLSCPQEWVIKAIDRRIAEYKRNEEGPFHIAIS